MEILHILGLCPDSYSHIDMIDIYFIFNLEIQYFFNKLKHLNYEVRQFCSNASWRS